MQQAAQGSSIFLLGFLSSYFVVLVFSHHQEEVVTKKRGADCKIENHQAGGTTSLTHVQAEFVCRELEGKPKQGEREREREKSWKMMMMMEQLARREDGERERESNDFPCKQTQ